MTRIATRLPLLFLLCASVISCRSGKSAEGLVNVPWGIEATGYPGHVEIRWNSDNGAQYNIYRLQGNRYVKVGTSDESPFLDFSIGSADSQREFTYALCPVGQSPKNIKESRQKFTVAVPAASDEALLETVQRYTTRYFTDFDEPFTGLARERSNEHRADIVTIGGSGFGLMALVAAMERGWIPRNKAIWQVDRALTFLEKAERFHGMWAHWYDADTREVFHFSEYDDGGDIVESAFMAQGLLTLRQYFKESAPELSRRADALWRDMEWDWYTRGTDSLYWHWSKNYGWKMNHRITGYDECFIAYVLGASSPTHPISRKVYESCYKNSSYYYNGKSYYGIPLTIGMEYGGPLFFTHYSFLGLDPHGLSDGLTDYYERGRAHSLIHYNYAIDNPNGFKGYGEDLWGFTSSDDPLVGYSSHHPGTGEDNGTVSPTAAVSSIVYTPEESLKCIRNLYYNLGSKVFGPMGFYDAYNPSMVEGEQVVRSYLAIDQGPIAVMVENYRSGILWDLFMSCPEIERGLSELDITTTR